MTTTETEQTRAQAQSTLIGRWTYRSFVSNPNIDADFASLEFGRGELRARVDSSQLGPGVSRGCRV